MSGPLLRFDHEKVGDRPIKRTRCIIGRNKDCGIRVPHERISGHHAEIFRHEGQWWIRDLGSTNGTHVDGSPVVDMLPLSDGCRVLIGRLYATFVASAAAPSQKGTGTRRSTSGSKAETPQTSLDRARKRPVRINPMWAAVAILVCGIVTFAILNGGSSDPAPQDVASGEGNETPLAVPDVVIADRDDDSSDDPGADGDDLDGDDLDRDDLDRDDPFANDDDSEVPAHEATTYRRTPADERKKNRGRDSQPKKTTPGETTPKNTPAPSGDSVTPKSTTKTPPPTDPLELALERGNALELAQLVRRSTSPRAAEVRRRLKEDRIFCLHRSGKLGGGDPQLLSAFGLHCAPDEMKEVTKLIPGCRIEEWKLKVRYFQDYSKGLGRRIGKRRMGPHPKTVTIELAALPGRTTPYTAELVTPRLNDVPADGYTDEQVWAMTLDDLTARIQAFL